MFFVFETYANLGDVCENSREAANHWTTDIYLSSLKGFPDLRKPVQTIELKYMERYLKLIIEAKSYTQTREILPKTRVFGVSRFSPGVIFHWIHTRVWGKITASKKY